MTQKQLNELFILMQVECNDDWDKAVPAFERKLKRLGGRMISVDWRAHSEEMEEMIKIMKKFGVIVLENPVYEGSNTYGYVFSHQ